MKTIIIGGVAAGMSAASKLRRLDNNAQILVYEKGTDLSYGACGMPYYLGNIIQDESKLIARYKEDFEKKNIQVFTNHEVIKVNPKTKTIEIKNLLTNEIITDKYDKLVIAVGTKANRTNIKGTDKANIQVLNQLSDARILKPAINIAESITIIGGGYIGLEIAENLAHLGKNVDIIERLDQLIPVYDKFIAKKAQIALETIGVNIHLQENLLEYLVKDNKISIKTNKREYQTDLVIEAIGVRPNTEFLNNIGLDMLKNGAIVVNDKMETSIKDIYAGGDCVAYHHLITGKEAFVPLGTHANKSGRVIAENIAGNKETFDGIVGSNIIKVDKLAIAKTGLGIEESKKFDYNYDYVDVTAKNQSGYYPGAKEIFIRIVFDPKTGVLKGAQLVGEKGVSDRINIMALAISKGLTAKEFSGLDLAYAPPFSPVWDPLQIATNQIKV
ncbi:MAG: CoA-disulfide reductase [Candidatus Izimaplasma sp.]|nr:CoA-disulfide reductase [Candidatus Izimaplasma bacterium]